MTPGCKWHLWKESVRTVRDGAQRALPRGPGTHSFAVDEMCLVPLEEVEPGLLKGMGPCMQGLQQLIDKALAPTVSFCLPRGPSAGDALGKE